MIICGIDFSGTKGTMGLAEDAALIAETSFDLQMKALPRILPQMDFILRQNHLRVRDVDLWMVVAGPGNWTGIRISVSLIKSMAFAVNRPVVGLCALDVLACHFRYTGIPVYSLVDAARHQVYFARYNCLGPVPQRNSAYALAPVPDLVQNIAGPAILTGSGALRYKDGILAAASPEIKIAPFSTSFISGRFLIEAGLAKLRHEGSINAHDLVPLYMQKADAEILDEMREKPRNKDNI